MHYIYFFILDNSTKLLYFCMIESLYVKVQSMGSYLSNQGKILLFVLIFIALEILKSEIMVRLKTFIREATLM